MDITRALSIFLTLVVVLAIAAVVVSGAAWVVMQVFG